MKNEKKVNYSEIGEVVYRKNSRARNISIRINSNGEVRVTVPRFCSYDVAESFVVKKHIWIRDKIVSIKRRKTEKPAWEAGSIIPMVSGRIYLEQGEEETHKMMQSGKDYHIFLKRKFDPAVHEDQAPLRELVGSIGLKEARISLPGMLRQVSQQVTLDYTKVSVRKMRSRWGSCSVANNISLSSSLIFLPVRLIEYVMVHELVHTIHKNHGKEFWDEVERLMPDAKLRRKQMRNYELF